MENYTPTEKIIRKIYFWEYWPQFSFKLSFSFFLFTLFLPTIIKPIPSSSYFFIFSISLVSLIISGLASFIFMITNTYFGRKYTSSYRLYLSLESIYEILASIKNGRRTLPYEKIKRIAFLLKFGSESLEFLIRKIKPGRDVTYTTFDRFKLLSKFLKKYRILIELESIKDIKKSKNIIKNLSKVFKEKRFGELKSVEVSIKKLINSATIQEELLKTKRYKFPYNILIKTINFVGKIKFIKRFVKLDLDETIFRLKKVYELLIYILRIIVIAATIIIVFKLISSPYDLWVFLLSIIRSLRLI